ncbi:Tyrosine-protein kinase receptor [Aphelenchoides besseyi]|nr:Tyrosine-protein kinase receptor [Aphelenchoides besseyi]
MLITRRIYAQLVYGHHTVDSKSCTNPLQSTCVSFVFLIGLLLIFTPSISKAQIQQRVYMLNSGYSAHFHVFTRVDEASIVDALDQIGLSINPCGINFMQSHKQMADIVLYYQLYRACDAINEPFEPPPTPVRSDATLKRLANKTWLDFDEMARSLGRLYNEEVASTHLGGLSGVERLAKFHERNNNDAQLKEIESLGFNMSTYEYFKSLRSRPKRSLLHQPPTSAAYQNDHRQQTLQDSNSYDTDSTLYDDFHLPVDDIGVDPEMFLSAFRRSKYADEGCAMKRLDPIGEARWLRPFTIDGHVDNFFLSTVLDTIKNRSKDYYLLDLFHRPVKCFSPCTTMTPIAPATMVCSGHQTNTFERGSENALWTFVNSNQIADSLAESKHAYTTGSQYVPPKKTAHKDDNFRVVVGSGQNHSNHYAYYSSHKPTGIVPMIVSAYFQHTSSACELVFKHRIHGVAGAELVVSTQHLERRAILREDEEDEEEAADWVRPTLHANFKPIRDGDDKWTNSRVSVGQIFYPTRVRIECHSAQQQKDPATQNVECNVDDIKMVNCDEELWKADVCAGKQAKKYLCHKHGFQQCIDYADVCDFHPECKGAEDEDNLIHECTKVPPGARCDFEFSSETGCPQWKFFSTSSQSTTTGNSSNQYLQLMSLDDKRLPSHGIPPGQYDYHGNTRIPDHQPNGEVLYTYAVTPTFPPTPLSVSISESPNFRACMVRFFYCHSGTATFQLMLETGSDFTRKEVLWTPPHSAGSEPCVWQKASTAIAYQKNEYRLKIAFGKLYKQPVSVAIDDFSMTPNCFHESADLRTRFAPDRLQVKNCNTTDCSPSTLNQTAYQANTTITINDRKMWFVPQTGAYRVELYGASGGQLPGQKTNNRGGVVMMNLRLQRGQSLGFVSGTAGMSPCDQEKRAIEIKSSPSLDLIWRVICNSTATPEDVEAARRDAQNLFGTSGGGASAIYLDEELIGVAGAGGGLFSDVFSLPEHHESSNEMTAGGHFVEDVNSTTTINNRSTFSTENWSAGNGASLSPLLVDTTLEVDSSRCPNCTQMFGRPAVSAVRHFIGGTCPQGRFWNITGGTGGGASCGPGGGGGSGFVGGVAGHKRNAQGGSSAVLISDVAIAWARGVHFGDGEVLVLRCSLICIEGSTCEFEAPEIGKEAVQYCLCSNGKRVQRYTKCGPSDSASFFTRLTFWISDLTDADPNTIALVLYIAFAFLVLTVLIGFVVFLVVDRSNWLTRWFQRHLKCCRREKQEMFCDMVEMKAIKKGAFWTRTSNGNRSEFFKQNSTIELKIPVTSNPIYERLSVGDLPQIPRNNISLVRSIGNGAFGEVYDAFLSIGETSHRVAVKTLPLDSNSGAECDFHIEAQMLHQLCHKNIIKFYGVAFEALPNYIVIEFMEGGDMRAFLRDSRPKPLTPIDQRYPLMMKEGRALMAIKWQPPESFLDGIFNSKTDVWSFGVVLWEIFTMGYSPYQHRQNQEVMEVVASGARLEHPIGTPQELYEIMLRCWNTEPELRPTFEELASAFSQLVMDAQLITLPLPPLNNRIIPMPQNSLSSTSSTTRSSLPTDDALTQGTMSTNMASSMTESMNSAVSMPTPGDGVRPHVYPAYIRRPLQDLINNQHNRVSYAGESSLSSHDDSTLHDTGSIRHPYQLDGDSNHNAWQQPTAIQRRRPPHLNLELTRPLITELPPENSPLPPLPPRQAYSTDSRSPPYNYSSSSSPNSSLSTSPGTPPPTMPRNRSKASAAPPEVPTQRSDYANEQDSPIV